MTHDEVARWARHAPGAVRRWYAEHPGSTRAEREQVRERCARLRAKVHVVGQGVVWAPVVRRPDGCWPAGYLLGVVAGPLAAGTSPVPKALVDEAWSWIEGLCGGSDARLPVQVGFLEVPEGDEPRDTSPGLAVAIALIAWVLDRAPAGLVVTSGVVSRPSPEPIVGGVGHVGVKREVCEAEAPGVDALVADSEVSVADRLVAWFGPGWRADLARALGSSALSLAMSAWDGLRRGQRDEAERQSGAAIAAWAGERQGGMAWLVRGACRLHRGEAGPALEDLRHARDVLAAPPAAGDEPLDPWQVEEVDAYVGIALLDCGRPVEAENVLAQALARLQAAPSADRRWHLVLLQVAGSLHRVRVLAGDLAGARDLLERVVLGAAPVRAERARSLGDLAEVLRRAGDTDGARARLEQARRCLADADPGVRARTDRFLQVYRARVGLRPADWPVAPPDWRQWPQPAEVLETLLAGGGDLDAWMREHALADERLPVVFTLVYLAAAARLPGPPRPWARELARRLAATAGIDEVVSSLACSVLDGHGEGLGARSPY